MTSSHRGLLAVLALGLSLPTHTVHGFAPQARLSLARGGAAPRSALALRQQPKALVRPQRTAGIYATASMRAPVAPAGALALTRAAVSRLAGLLLATVATVLLTACRALAVSTAKTAAASEPFAITGGMVKWGSVGLVFGAAYIFRRDEKPIVKYVDEDVPAAAPATQLDGPASADGSLDDSSMFSALNARMLELAKEREQADADDAPPPPKDSSDDWGTGNTGVLERPDPDKLPTGDSIDFPVGFPLRDFEPEEEDVVPTASADEIAMLERMFGPPSTSSD